ncbi:MAG: manganese efflux pump [Bacillota bacterium]|nr:manganese efflux pump [Bacillota bacterium]
MNIFDIAVIGTALSLDAFGVSLSIGLNSKVKRTNKCMFAVSFGFFQFAFAFLGGLFGNLFNAYILEVPGVIGGIITAFVGVLMVKEGFNEQKECLLIKPKMYFVLGISVSIDALVIGFTVLNTINKLNLILKDTIYIGVITLCFSFSAFYIAKYLKKINLVCKYADYIGGIVLIVFGIHMMFF